MNQSQNALLKLLAETPAAHLPLPMAYADPAFRACLDEVINTPKLLESFDRLTGNSLSHLGSRSVIERMVDKATGFQDEQFRMFIEFIHDCLYLRLPGQCVNSFRAATWLGKGRNEAL